MFGLLAKIIVHGLLGEMVFFGPLAKITLHGLMDKIKAVLLAKIKSDPWA